MVELDEGGDDRYFIGHVLRIWRSRMGGTFNGYNIKSIMEKYGCSSRPVQCSFIWSIIYMTGESGFGGSPFDNCQKHVKEIKAALCKDAGSNDHGTLTPGLSCFYKWKPAPDIYMEGKCSFCDHDPSGKQGSPL